MEFDRSQSASPVFWKFPNVHCSGLLLSDCIQRCQDVREDIEDNIKTSKIEHFLDLGTQVTDGDAAT